MPGSHAVAYGKCVSNSTAKGGVLLGIADQFKLPVRYLGVGEKAADLRAFNAADYVDSLF